MNETQVTLTLTAGQARRIIRALERSRRYWHMPEQLEGYENAVAISHDYRELANEVRDQIKAQDVAP